MQCCGVCLSEYTIYEDTESDQCCGTHRPARNIGNFVGTPVFNILQVKYVEGLRSFHRESVFCSKISSGGSLFIEKLVTGGGGGGGGPILGGVHFYHDRTLLASNPGFPLWILSRSRFFSKAVRQNPEWKTWV